MRFSSVENWFVVAADQRGSNIFVFCCVQAAGESDSNQILSQIEFFV